MNIFYIKYIEMEVISHFPSYKPRISISSVASLLGINTWFTSQRDTIQKYIDIRAEGHSYDEEIDFSSKKLILELIDKEVSPDIICGLLKEVPDAERLEISRVTHVNKSLLYKAEHDRAEKVKLPVTLPECIPIPMRSKRKVESFINTSFGCENETLATNLFEKTFGIKIADPEYAQFDCGDFIIQGICDGTVLNAGVYNTATLSYVIEEKLPIEIKNRKSAIKGPIPEYEKIQVQLEMLVYKSQVLCFIQYHSEVMDVRYAWRDQKFIDDIIEQIRVVVHATDAFSHHP